MWISAYRCQPSMQKRLIEMDSPSSNISTSISAVQSQAIDEMVRTGRFPTKSAALREIVNRYFEGSAELQALKEENESLKAELARSKEGSSERVSVFLDVRNVVQVVRKQRFQIDFAELRRIAVGGRHLVEALAFDGRLYSTEKDTTKAFHDVLMHRGWGLDLRDNDNCEHQKEVDVALAASVMLGAMQDTYDTAVIISGDRDFVPAIERIRAMGKRVEIISYESALSSQMKRLADRLTLIDDLFVVSISAEYSDSEPKEATA